MSDKLIKTGASTIILGDFHYKYLIPHKKNKLLKVTKLSKHHNEFNHLDKINATSSGNFKPFVLIRVLVGSKKPIDAGPQHSQNYSSALKKMITQIKLVDLKNKNNVFKEYKKALKNKQTTIFVEYSEKY